jgi:transposase-like protein
MTDHDLHAGDGPRADRPKRRTFTAAYKLRVIEEYDAAKMGEKGALLRREGLYESSISLWRRHRDSGQLTASGAAPPVRKRKSPEQAELEQLRKENERLARKSERVEKKLAQTEAALEIVGKWHALLGMMSESADSENS